MGRGFGQRLLCTLLPTLSHARPGAPLGVQTVARSCCGVCKHRKQRRPAPLSEGW